MYQFPLLGSRRKKYSVGGSPWGYSFLTHFVLFTFIELVAHETPIAKRRDRPTTLIQLCCQHTDKDV
jgi:hypothetical protein